MSDRDARDLVRLVAQMDRTVALHQPDFSPNLDKAKLARLNGLTQRQVPAVVYESKLPAVGVCDPLLESSLAFFQILQKFMIIFDIRT